jgi:hypothetical protein
LGSELASRFYHRKTFPAGDRGPEAQLGVATEALRATVLRLLRASEVHPQLLLLAVARVNGELAATTLAGGRELEPLLGELAEVVRHAGREHHQMLQVEMLPVASQRLILGPVPSCPKPTSLAGGARADTAMATVGCRCPAPLEVAEPGTAAGSVLVRLDGCVSRRRCRP